MASPVPASALLRVTEQSRETFRCGVPEIDQRLQGLPRGAITELTGFPSGGRSATVATLFMEATNNLECCCYVDGLNVLDVIALRDAGVDLSRLLWVRSGGSSPDRRSEQSLDAALKAADLILHAGGFGLICLDLAGFPPRLLNRIPVSYWFRFRRAVQDTRTVFLTLAGQPLARSCASVWLRFEPSRPVFSGVRRGRLFEGLQTRLSIEKPGAPRVVEFQSRAV